VSSSSALLACADHRLLVWLNEVFEYDDALTGVVEHMPYLSNDAFLSPRPSQRAASAPPQTGGSKSAAAGPVTPKSTKASSSQNKKHVTILVPDSDASDASTGTPCKQLVIDLCLFLILKTRLWQPTNEQLGL
jgi:hypothetical protein